MDLATLGLDAARAADPARYGMSGAVPRAAVKPTSREEVAEALRAAGADDLKVVPWGGGVSLHLGEPPPRYDVALDLTALDRIVEYDPEDFTVTAECGVTLAALGAALDARGQELPLEGTRADRATLGGVLAANASGPRRLRFGAPVDRILGARFALGDGTPARSGGRVVKNVAGYAIHRLLCGSRGGLGVILEASLKLAPRPESRAALVYGTSAAQVTDVTRWAPFPRMEPAVLTVVGRELARTLHIATPTPSDFVVIVGFEDDAPWVESQVAATIERLGEPEARLDGADAIEMWRALADLEEQPPPRASFTTADHTPAALAPLTGGPHAEALVFHAAAGRLHVHLDPTDAQALADALVPAGFALMETRGVAIAPGPIAPVAVARLRRGIADALDPAGRFALGAGARGRS